MGEYSDDNELKKLNYRASCHKMKRKAESPYQVLTFRDSMQHIASRRFGMSLYLRESSGKMKNTRTTDIIHKNARRAWCFVSFFSPIFFASRKQEQIKQIEHLKILDSLSLMKEVICNALSWTSATQPSKGLNENETWTISINKSQYCCITITENNNNISTLTFDKEEIVLRKKIPQILKCRQLTWIPQGEPLTISSGQ